MFDHDLFEHNVSLLDILHVLETLDKKNYIDVSNIKEKDFVAKLEYVLTPNKFDYLSEFPENNR